MDVKNIIKQMTIEEKSSLLSGKNFWETQEINKYKIPSMFLADGPHGIRRQAAAADHLGLNESIAATCFPTAVSLANTWNLELVEKMGQALGLEALEQKVNMLLGPGTNIKRNPLCGRNFEYYSEDPYLSGKIVSSEIRGIQANGIAATIKHFAGNNQEERRLVLDSIIDERTLREIYLMPFEMAIKESNPQALMTSYNKLNGIYTNEHPYLLKNILRNEWNYQGLIVTDWGGNNDRVLALKMSSDLEMPATNGETDEEVVKAIINKELDEKYLDESVERIIKLSLETNLVLAKNKQKVNYDDHHKIAKKIADEAIVLLKNKDNLLPLKAKTKVAIIGDFAKNPRFQGAGSSIVNPTKIDNTLENIDNYDFKFIGYEQGFKRYGKKSKKLIKRAIKLAHKAEVLLVYLGLDEITEVEGLDRKDMDIPLNQLNLLKELIKTNKKIVVVLSCGSAVLMPFANDVDAIVHGYLLGQAGATSILDVISGIVNPSGKLSETIPLSYQDVSSSKYFPGKEVTVEYREGLYVGYRYYDKVKKNVLYPFGYGLSYTKFAYSNIKTDNKGVTFKLKNIGSYSGSEIAQLYITKDKKRFFRADNELKGFVKVHLEINEEKEVFIPFDEYSFRYFNPTTNQFEIEKGVYNVYIASSSRNYQLEDQINLTGTTTEYPYKDINLPNYDKGTVFEISREEFELLLGRKTPNPNRIFIKKNRIEVNYNTTVAELKYARGFTGRLFSQTIRFLPKFFSLIGKRQFANTIYMGVYHQPMRGLSRMTDGAISWNQLDGLIMMFNGKFFKGVNHFLKSGRLKRKRNKLIKKAKKEDALNASN